ncbi:hypothetical protein KR222_002067, partial [Zaprionus bogoriensis]
HLKIAKHNRRTIFDWMKDIADAFPLPEAPPSQCRDVFLNEIFEDYQMPELTESSESSSEDYSDDYRGVHFQTSSRHKTIEETLFRKLLRSTMMKRASSLRSWDSHRMTVVNLNKLLKDRCDTIANSIRFVATLSTLYNLRNKIMTLHQRWLTQTSVDKSLNMFSWSIKHYFARFKLDNMIYLDTLQKELGKKMESFKYCVDLREIIRLVEAIITDYRQKVNICEHSMLAIKDAQVDIKHLLMDMQKAAEDEYQAIKSAPAPRAADPIGARMRKIVSTRNYLDFVMPIEGRYAINWAQTKMEQAKIYDNIPFENIKKEIDWLRQEIYELNKTWHYSAAAYSFEHSYYRERTSELEAMYLQDMDQMDVEIGITRNKIVQAKEDLKLYRERIPMFHTRIDEVQEIIRQRE